MPTNNSIPPSKRRVLMVMDRKTRRELSEEPATARMMEEPGVIIAEFPLPPELESTEFGRNIVAAAMDNPGTILIQSPYSFDDYQPVDLAEDKFGLQKHFHLNALCSRLGAKSVKVVDIDSTTRESELDVKASVKTVKGQGRGGFEGARADSFKKHFELKAEFNPSPVDLDSAREYLAKHRLQHDPSLSHLFEICSSGKPSKYQLTLDLTSDSRQNTKLAVRVAAALPAIFSISTEVQHAVRQSARHTLILEIEFHPQ